tara:strand:+ start:69 stop:470 length:402 start_codon:yes stop_codon:yes gene_type:complete
MKRATVIVGASALAFLLFALHYSYPQVTLTTPIQVTVAGDGSIGFNTDTEALTFGKLGPNGIAKRTIRLMNHEKRERTVTYLLSGEVQSWVSLSNSSYLLPSNASLELPVTLRVPPHAIPGNYTGTVTFFFSR